jgi:tRNA pseudouridine38-40 synthase
MRYFFTIAYKGTAFHGWQKQPNAIGVQQVIEEKLSLIERKQVEIVGSGRTDAGVHASQQVFHVDLETAISGDDWKFKLNNMLPGSIAITAVNLVKEEAHARFDAVSRSYEYKIAREKSPFQQDLVYRYTPDLDLDKMNAAAEKLKNHIDFECFSKVKTDVFTFNCEITKAYWKQQNDLLVFYVSANRFLRGMVRAIVGTLLEVGRGNLSIQQFDDIIQQKDRRKAGRAVPPEGLFLSAVEYPDEIYL